MGKSRSFLSILIPSATVFFSSGCIMVLELVAGRLVAKYLGASLYTWTSVIGVVLAGITIGNYIGGRVADRFQARKALAVLFGISSLTCVVIVVLNNLVGDWILLWRLSWPMRVFTHVSLVFLIPSTLLGTISPVVAKMALDRGLPTGRTVGDIYAWGAAGSIVGTFLAGFYLIAAMGTIAIIWAIGAVLLLMAILYWARLWVLYIWGAIFIALMTMGMAPADWAESTGSSLALREKPNPQIIYKDETQYCYVSVRRPREKPDIRTFKQDKLIHSQIDMGDITDLKYDYEQIHAAITHRFSRDKDNLSVLMIGGGGYVFPRYVEKLWPGSRIDVAEIDPGVTEAAMQAFGLDRNTSIRTFTMDARNYVDKLLEQEHTGQAKTRYDFIYEDALNDYSIPFQLTTREFNDKLAVLLGNEGIYMVELIDIFDSGLFLGAFVNTLQKTFPYVYVITRAKRLHSVRSTFVVAAANRELDLENLAQDYKNKKLDLWFLNESEIEMLKEKTHRIILTDDYAPVENLLAPVVRDTAKNLSADKHLDDAAKLQQQGKLDEAIAKYEKAMQIDPAISIKAYNGIALIQAKQGKFKDAAENLKKALEFNERTPARQNLPSVHFNLAAALQNLNQPDQAMEHFQKAAEGFRDDLAWDPNSASLWARLGYALAEMEDFSQASEAFKRVVTLNPGNIEAYDDLVRSLESQGRYDEAISELRKGIWFMLEQGRKDDAIELKKSLELVEFKKSNPKK